MRYDFLLLSEGAVTVRNLPLAFRVVGAVRVYVAKLFFFCTECCCVVEPAHCSVMKSAGLQSDCRAPLNMQASETQLLSLTINY